MSKVNEVDVAFVVDTTSSMGSFIKEAQEHMTQLVKDMSEAADIDLRVAIIQYRDHPPEEDTFVTETFDLTGDLQKVQNKIDKLTVNGGGDGPEAVFDGCAAAVDLKWRKHAMRLAILIGDAPAHGYEYGGDHWPDGCPCGKTAESTSGELEGSHIVLYAVGMQRERALKDSFTEVASLTGGQFFDAPDNQVIKAITEILKQEFEHVEVDKKIYEAVEEDKYDPETLAEELGISVHQVSTSYYRLQTRELVEA